MDWSSQEIAIAGALSGDDALWKAYESGDPYIEFAKQAGLAPPDATKQSHKEIRQACKSIVLGVNYGMGPETPVGKPVLKTMELGPRDRVSQAFWHEQKKGNTSVR